MGDVSSRALRTLLALHAPSRLSGRLYSMRKMADLSVDVRDLFDVNLRMTRHGSARGATMADLESAVSIWFEPKDSDRAGDERDTMNAA